jgi:ATP-dependent DNA ligase
MKAGMARTALECRLQEAEELVQRVAEKTAFQREMIATLDRRGHRRRGGQAASEDALHSLKVRSAYVDGELCALNADGVPTFSRLQAAMDEGRTDQLVFFAFDLLFLNGESITRLPLIQHKERLQRLFKKETNGLRYSEHVVGGGPRFRKPACKLGLEGAISKLADRPYAPGDRGIWVKSKCLNRECGAADTATAGRHQAAVKGER